MENTESFTDNNQTIEQSENEKIIHLKWKGKSIDRDPSGFITPILINVFDKSKRYGKEIILDFLEMDYMNSSTITPISRFLEKTKNDDNKVSIIYNKMKKWQELSFSALKIFETKDKRIEITGK